MNIHENETCMKHVYALRMKDEGRMKDSSQQSACEDNCENLFFFMILHQQSVNMFHIYSYTENDPRD